MLGAPAERALVRPEQDGCVCSSGFCALAPHAAPAEVLPACLRLPVFCELMNLHTTASMYPAIAATDRPGCPSPRPPAAASRPASVPPIPRQQARQLLERARRAVEIAIVEIAIEENEAAALKSLV